MSHRGLVFHLPCVSVSREKNFLFSFKCKSPLRAFEETFITISFYLSKIDSDFYFIHRQASSISWARKIPDTFAVIDLALVLYQTQVATLIFFNQKTNFIIRNTSASAFIVTHVHAVHGHFSFRLFFSLGDKNLYGDDLNKIYEQPKCEHRFLSQSDFINLIYLWLFM